MTDEKTVGQGQIRLTRLGSGNHLSEMVRGTVEETLNAMLDAEADRLCGAARYERNNACPEQSGGADAQTLRDSNIALYERSS